MSNGSTPAEAIPILGVSTREEINAYEESHLDKQYGSGSWTLSGRSSMTYESRNLECLDVSTPATGDAQIYFDISAVATDDEATTRGIWDDNDQKPTG